jgi:hypothetical protein
MAWPETGIIPVWREHGCAEVYVGEWSPQDVRDSVKARGYDPDSEEGSMLVAAAHPLSRPDFRWPSAIVPRWNDEDTSECVAALSPSGEREMTRYIEGAERRGDPPLALIPLGGQPTGPSIENPGRLSGSPIPGEVFAARLPSGIRPTVAPGLEAPDRELAARIRSSGDPWSSYELRAIPPGSSAPKLQGLLFDATGRRVAAVWRPAGGHWYFLPPSVPWTAVVDWLVNVALPAFVPRTTNLIRAKVASEERFLTAAEEQARAELEDFDRRVADERAERVRRGEEVGEEADEIRRPLLFGSGAQLTDAVAAVLQHCGFTITDLDQELGTVSADLLATRDDQRWLIEVKGKSGAAKQVDVTQTAKHRTTWDTENRGELAGTILILNHENSQDPSLRAPKPYDDPGWVEAIVDLGVAVIPSMTLCEWWAKGDCQAIVEAVTGPPGQYGD